LRNQKHSLHVASWSSCTGVTNTKRKCEITWKMTLNLFLCAICRRGQTKLPKFF
jgi:hypothetical protein